ncbi:MAG: dTDP-4-dehydrorhamnose reductase [Thermoleophilia bacterium]|nr:dTDP-4-dehydrorhamnose reductase [Thermoleophilia bacterium]
MSDSAHASAVDPDRSTILVTGAGGQLGAAVVEAAARRGIDAVGLGRAELDVTDAARVLELVEGMRPAAVVHCAAWTDVDGAEADREGAFRVNEAGSRAVAQACRATGAHLVAVSTDYVFPGTAPEGYAEGDATGPINVYGESKLAGEAAIRDELGDAACIARTAWLFSAQAPNFVQTIARAARDRDALDVVDDQRGNPTWCGHLADALLTCAVDRIGGTHHLVDGPEATWRDLAAAVVEELGLECEVRPTTSDAYPRPAKRAAVSVLRVTDPRTPAMGEWRDGVRASLAPRVDVG